VLLLLGREGATHAGRRRRGVRAERSVALALELCARLLPALSLAQAVVLASAELGRRRLVRSVLQKRRCSARHIAGMEPDSRRPSRWRRA
jgi:hypothetical protein